MEIGENGVRLRIRKVSSCVVEGVIVRHNYTRVARVRKVMWMKCFPTTIAPRKHQVIKLLVR